MQHDNDGSQHSRRAAFFFCHEGLKNGGKPRCGRDERRGGALVSGEGRRRSNWAPPRWRAAKADSGGAPSQAAAIQAPCGLASSEEASAASRRA